MSHPAAAGGASGFGPSGVAWLVMLGLKKVATTTHHDPLLNNIILATSPSSLFPVANHRISVAFTYFICHFILKATFCAF